jgi:iron transport multicopper oxidase
MKVLETDGEETAYHNQESYSVFPIFPAQRLSLLLEANQEPGNFWIRAEPSFMTLGAPVYPSNQTGVNMAILRYKGAPNKEPTTNQTGFDLAVEETFIPLKPLPGISGTPDISMVLNIGVNASNPAAPAFTINNYTYSSVPVPILLQILNGTDPRQLLPAGSVITLPRNKLIELKIPGGSILSPHPFHLHGHKFGVVRSAGTSFVNEVNPPIRDTVSTGGLTSDNVTMRFTTDNPGPWIFHCHIDFHLEAGLAVVFAEDPEGIISGPKSQKITDSWKELCPIWDGLKSGKQFSLSDIP